MVLDTAYCHRVVWTSLRNTRKTTTGGRKNRRQLFGRQQAEEICRRFNNHGTRLPTANWFQR